MNISKIEWTEYACNPITGKCPHGCSYCYAERIRERYGRSQQIKYHPEKLVKVMRARIGRTIFWGSMFDIWADAVEWVWQKEIISIIQETMDKHTHILLTKNPKKYVEHSMIYGPVKTPLNVWLGETITQGRASGLPVDWISIEPLTGKVDAELRNLKQVIVGAMTGPHAIRPEREWVEDIIAKCDKSGAALFIRPNLIKIFPDLPEGKLLWRVDK